MAETGIPYADIHGLQFGILTDNDIINWRLPCVTQPLTKRNPSLIGTINCPSNGPLNASNLCITCGNDIENCTGHLCYIPLFTPVINVNYLPLLLKIFPTICIRCMRVLAPTHMLKTLHQSRVSSAESYVKCVTDLNKLCSKTNRVCWFPEDNAVNGGGTNNTGAWAKKRKRNEANQPAATTSASTDEASEMPHLLDREEAEKRGYCGAVQPDLWMVHERFFIRPTWYIRSDEEYENLPIMTPLKLYGMLKYVQKDLIQLYGFHPDHSPLFGMMMSRLCVPPPLMRLPRSGRDKEDDLTILLANIFKLNLVAQSSTAIVNLTLGLVIPPTMTDLPTTTLSIKARSMMTMVQGEMSTEITRKRVPIVSKCMEHYFYVQREVAVYLDSKYNSAIDTEYKRNPVSLRTRFSPRGDDHGLIRGKMMGKPSDFCARGVASCDTAMDIDEIGIPLRVAMNVTIPDIVTPYNFYKLLRAVMNGRHRYPGCNFIRVDDMSFAPDSNCSGLRLGSIVDRHLVNGDPVIANRAPSLHRFAIMGYRARIHKASTINGTLALCGVLNLDFDGDELNASTPQSEAQKAEVVNLISVKKNLVRDGELVIGCVQHAAIGAERATNERFGPVMFRRPYIHELLMIGNNESCRKLFEARWQTFNKSQELTGRQFVHLLLPTYDASYILVKRSLNACIRDTISCGDDMDDAANLIGFLTRILETIASFSGTTVLLDDVLHKTSQQTLTDANTIYDQANHFARLQIRDSEPKHNDVQPPSYLKMIGITSKQWRRSIQDTNPICTQDANPICTQDANPIGTQDAIALEDDICESLGRYRDVTGKPLLDHLANKQYESSGIHTIVSSGAKGDVTAIVQNLKTVGQQNNEYSMRYHDTTSHYYRDECSKFGFARHALIESLTPTEYFFCLRSGRVGLVRTSCETSGIGYVYRKIFKSLEDLRICFGNTVRNANGQIMVFQYGYDTTFLRKLELETVQVTIPECVALFSTENDDMSIAEVEHLLLLRQRVVTDRHPVNNVLVPLHYDRVCESVLCDLDSRRTHKKSTRHRCTPVNLNAARNRVCKLWNTLVLRGNIPSTPAHELAFFEQLSSRKLRDRQYLQCAHTFDQYMNHVENMLVSNVCCVGDACGMRCSQDTTQPNTQAGLSLFRLAGEKTTVLQGTERFKEIINLPKVMQQPMMTIYLYPEAEADFDPMTLIELRLVYIVTQFDDIPALGTWDLHQSNIPPSHPILQKPEDSIVHLSLYLDKDAMHRRQLSPRIVCQYLQRVRVLLFDIANIAITYAQLDDEDWWVTISVPLSSSIWKAVAPEIDMPKPARSALLMHTLKSDKMLLAGIEGIRDFKLAEKPLLVADETQDGKLVTIQRKCIITQGSNLQAVCSLPGVDVALTTTTNIWQMFYVFGIDAAQCAIYEGLMEALNITPDNPASQHVQIIAATMCYSGCPSPMTYSGMTSRDSESWLQRALFERSFETFRGAGIAAHYNNIRGVSPAIMVGAPISLGTGGDFEIFNNDAESKTPKPLTTSTQDHKMAAQRFLSQGTRPLGKFKCPLPHIADFLAIIKDQKCHAQDLIRIQLQDDNDDHVGKKRTRKPKPASQDIFVPNYLTPCKGTRPFIPSSPKHFTSKRGHFPSRFIPSSPKRK